jgi:hypothetical protein
LVGYKERPKISSTVVRIQGPKYLQLLVGYKERPKISSTVGRIQGKAQNIFN